MLYLFGQLALSDSLFYDADYQVADCQPAAAPAQRPTAPEPAPRAAAGDHSHRGRPQPQPGRPTSPTSAC